MTNGYITVKSTLQTHHKHTATHCNTLQHTATTHCNALQRTATRCNIKETCYDKWVHYCQVNSANTPQTHCNALQHTATHCKSTLQYTATHCNTLQHTATHKSWCILKDIILFFPHLFFYLLHI